MKNYIIIFVLFVLSTTTIAQANRICLGGFYTGTAAFNANYSISIDRFFLQPNYSLTYTMDGNKESFSFKTYELDLGLYVIDHPDNKFYVAFGGSYNPFISQSFSGNAVFISDLKPPYYYVGKTREDSYGLTGKIGVIKIAPSGFTIGFEAKYIVLYTTYSNNYGPMYTSIEKHDETINRFILGVLIGYSF